MGKLEGDLRVLWCACFCREVEVTCPNPSLNLRGPGTFPVFRNPLLTGLTSIPRSGEQILQVFLILRPILENVHGEGLKLSELI